MLEREALLKLIIARISWLATECELRGFLHLFDANTISHELFCRLLNELYGLHLIQTDKIQQNFPAIDLGDERNKEAFQITTEKDGAKIQKTVDTYLKHGLAERFGHLRILVIGQKQSGYKSVKVPDGVDFAPETDVLDLRDLLLTIDKQDTEKLRTFARIIEEEIKAPRDEERDKLAPSSHKSEDDGARLPTHNKSAKTAVSRLPRTGDYLVGRDRELAVLDIAWDSEKTRVVQIVAPGGVGKTQLVKQWRQTLVNREDRQSIRVYDWSFYSQGTQQQASADEFFDTALRWFGETTPEKYKDPWGRGERLAELIRTQRTLLILDGLEPLQHPPGPLEGELSDPSLQSLLRGLSEFNPGLCVVTTCQSVPDLSSIYEPQRQTIDLTTLTEADGVRLLQLYGVHGSDEELRQASRDYGGHSLSLILLATYVRDRFRGDIKYRNRLFDAHAVDYELQCFSGDELTMGAAEYAKHARKIMASYVAWFENEPDPRATNDHRNDDLTVDERQISRAAVSILFLIGLFNRPVDAGCLNSLRAGPPIPGLNEPLFAWDDRQSRNNRDCLFENAVRRLRKASLLDDVEVNELGNCVGQQTLNAHPLVREYFCDLVERQLPGAVKEANLRVYKYLSKIAPELPLKLSEMMALYHAVSHGCKAGEFEASYCTIYRKRIQQHPHDFSTRMLHAYAQELVLLRSFFVQPWREVVPQLKAFICIVNLPVPCLRALGRLREAIEAGKLGVDINRN